MVTQDMSQFTPLLQGKYSSINTLFKGILRGYFPQPSRTGGSILIRQKQLLPLWISTQYVSHNVQRPLPVHNGDGQFIHPFQPPCLPSGQERLAMKLGMGLMVSVDGAWHAFKVTAPLYTGLVNG